MGWKFEISKILPDSMFLKIQHRRFMGKTLNLKNPKTFNEKLQWLKIYDRNPEYIKLIDKYEVKKVVEEIIGKEYVIPTLGVYKTFDDIDFNRLPNAFVLKCTHDSGSVVVCRDKQKLDINSTKKKLRKGLKTNFYWYGREWPYKMVVPRIIAEQYIGDLATGELNDYKFFCFNGVVDNVMIVRDRAEGNPHFYHFDKNWNLCRFNRLGRSLPEGYCESKPEFMDDMINLAERLSSGLRHVRVDMYESNGRIYFGEYTLYNMSGWETGFDDISDQYLGSLLHLPCDKY